MRLDPDHVACVLLDALALGDVAAARKWSVSRKTVQRYRQRMREDRELSALVAEKMQDFETELGAMRVRFLRRALAAMERMVDAEGTRLIEVAEAVRVVGELHQVSEALGEDESNGPDPEPSEDEGGRGVEAAHAH